MAVKLGLLRLDDKIKLDYIYAQVNRRPLIYTINKRQLGWLGHTLRRDKDEPTTNNLSALWNQQLSNTVKQSEDRKNSQYTSQISKLITAGAKR